MTHTAQLTQAAQDVLSEREEVACLRYDFDADSKGDSDVLTLNMRMVTAAKDYPSGTCFPCLGGIAKGERHRNERGLSYGEVITCRSCAVCCKAMAAFQLGTDYDSMEWRYTLGRSRADQFRAAAATMKEQPK